MSQIRVKVLSRRGMERVTVHTPSKSAWIGITRPGGVFADVNLEQFNGHICLEFLDIKAPATSNEGLDNVQANELAKFISSMINQGVIYFYINCEGGLSRSAGVAMAIERHFNNIVYDKDSRYNRDVYRKILAALEAIDRLK